MTPNLARRFTAEFTGTAFLVAAVVGSGIMGERLSGGNAAITLLANSAATGAVLVALILTFAPISGAHFNPAVTLGDAIHRRTSIRDAAVYVIAQVSGAFAASRRGMSCSDFRHYSRQTNREPAELNGLVNSSQLSA